MKKPLIQNRDRWLAIALLCLVIVLVYIIIIMPLITVADDYRGSIEDLEFKLQRYERLAAQKESVLRQFDNIKKQQAANNNFISKKSPALASADLQKLVKSTITGAGGVLTSTQVVPSREQDQFQRIAIKVRMTGGIELLRTVLYELESARPMLIIENINIRGMRGRRNRRTRKIDPSDQLNVNFEVFGFMRP